MEGGGHTLSRLSVYLCVGWRHDVGCGERDLLVASVDISDYLLFTYILCDMT